MNPSQARAILVQARTDETYDGPVPEDDDAAINQAKALVDMAEMAWSQHVRGPKVEAILRLAHEDSGGNGNGQVAEQEPERESGPETSERPAASAADEQPVPAESPEDEPEEDLSEIEPWDGYADEKVPDIVEAINIGIESDEDPQGLLAHVFLYEKAHKNRIRILKHLTGHLEALEAKPEITSEPDEESEPASASEPQPKSEPEPEPEVDRSEAVETELPPDEGPTMPVVEPDTEIPPQADTDYADLIDDVEQHLKRERLHVPPPIEDEPVDVPFDLTLLTDKELQRLHGAFSMYAYRAAYLLLREEAMARRCRDAADELARALMVAADKYDTHEKQKTMTILEAEVESDSEVMKWRKRHHKHDLFAHSYRQERDSYVRFVEALSRQHTMRNDEFLRAGGK